MIVIKTQSKECVVSCVDIFIKTTGNAEVYGKVIVGTVSTTGAEVELGKYGSFKESKDILARIYAASYGSKMFEMP